MTADRNSVTISIGPGLLQELDQLADLEEETRSAIARQAIRNHLARNKHKIHPERETPDGKQEALR